MSKSSSERRVENHIQYGDSDDDVDDYEDEPFQPMRFRIRNRVVDNNDRRKCYECFESVKDCNDRKCKNPLVS